MSKQKRSRRRFLKDSAILTGLAVGGLRPTSGQTLVTEKPLPSKDLRAYGERSPFVNSVRLLDPTGQLTPLQDSVGIITPASLHFTQSRGYDPPDINPQEHRLLIHGMVDRPLIFTLEEIKRFPSVSRIYFLECGGNSGRTAILEKADTVQRFHGKTSCSEWTGVLLSVLFREVGLQNGAEWIVAEGADAGKRTESIPMSKAMDDVMVAYGQNGEDLRPSQGYPLRLVLPGWNGGKAVKWLRRIKVVEQSYMAKQESASLSAESQGHAPLSEELPPKSVITRPSGGQKLQSRGFYEISGLAWSGAGIIRRVEVSVDDGKTWKDAQLQEPVYPKAHTRFRLGWNWNGEETVLQSRCTDERGVVQPTLAEISKIRGVTSEYWTSNYFQSAATQDRFGLNAVQPWRISRDGSVHNALF